MVATLAVADCLQTLVDRYDPEVFEVGRGRARIRVEGAGPETVDVLLEAGTAQLSRARGRHPDALMRADAPTWEAIATDARGGMDAFRRGALSIRRDLNLGIGFLAATSDRRAGSLRFRSISTPVGALSIAEAGTEPTAASGPPVLLIHGLGSSKISFFPTLASLARDRRAVAIDLPGFGDSAKPLRAAYDPPFFARAVVGLLDALEIDRAHLVGNSMGGRVALELGLEHADRVGRLGLLAPSLAWLAKRPWAPPLRLVAPQLGFIQPAPRTLVEGIVNRVVPGSDQGMTAAGIDDFMRAYLTPRGRAAFYTAARSIYLEEPHGPRGFWTRLPSLAPDSLFVWGRRDTLVPIAFARHVREALPGSEQLELDCGHVPQLEMPRRTHEALTGFFDRD